MTGQEAVHPHEKLLVLAGDLILCGLGVGIVMIFLAITLLDVRARLQSVVEKRFGPGETVFRQGDFPDRLYLIGMGEAEVIREVLGGEDISLARLKTGEFFGEMGIIGNTPRSATVKAATELETLSIHRSYIAPIFSYLPTWQEKVRRDNAQRTAMNRDAHGGE